MTLCREAQGRLRAARPDPFAAEAAPTILNQHRRTAFRPELFSEIIRLRLNGIHLFFKDIRLAWNFAAVSDSIVLSALVTRLFTSLSRRATRLPQAGCFFLPRGTPNGCASGLFYCTIFIALLYCTFLLLWVCSQESIQNIACLTFALPLQRREMLHRSASLKLALNFEQRVGRLTPL